MARTSLVINITFTGFIMLSIAQMAVGVLRLEQVLGVSGPSETVNIERHGTLIIDLDNGVVRNEGKTEVKAAKELVNVKDDGEGTVDLENLNAKTHARPTGANVAGVEVNRSGDNVVDLPNCKVYAANGLVDLEKCGDKTADSRKDEVQKDGIPATKVPENSYPADNKVPATENNNGSYN